MSFQTEEIVGAYKIVDLIGSGGVGQVYRAEHIITRRIEALKVLSGRPEAREQAQRFLREIQIQASLSHPNIATVHNAFWFGEDLVMVMELVDGESLRRILEEGRIPLDLALDYAGQALSALEYAHARHVTHRDITPGNMLVNRGGGVKLTDFGLAKSPADMRLTQTGVVVGSVYYMSPEQVRAIPGLDPRSDIYSLGVVLYEMITGVKPFDGDSAFEVMSAHVSRPPAPPADVHPALPPALSGIVLKALAKDPAQRFQSAGEFRAALESIGRAPVKKTAAPVALRWGVGAVAVFLAALLPNLINRSVPVPVVSAVPAAPRSSVEPRPVKPAVEPSFRKIHDIQAGAEVWAVALSSSGKWLAAGTEEGDIEIWDATSGERNATLRGHTAGVSAVCFSRDENSLASGSVDRTARLWDLRTETERDSLRRLGFVTAIALSADGHWVAIGSSDKKVRFWSLKERERSGGFREQHEPRALAFSPQGLQLAVAGDESLKLRSVSSGREVQSFNRPGAGAIAFTPEGQFLALSATTQAVKLWDVAKSHALAAIAPAPRVRALSVSQNGNVIAFATQGGGVSIWKAGSN